MEHIQIGVTMMILLLVFTAIIGICTKSANGIGEKLRVGKFFMRLHKSIGRDSKYKNANSLLFFKSGCDEKDVTIIIVVMSCDYVKLEVVSIIQRTDRI